MKSYVCASGGHDESRNPVVMGATRVRVRLRIEPAVLSSALQQFLAGNPGLEVEVCSANDDSGRDIERARRPGLGRVVEITLLDDPFRFRIETDGLEWIVNYRSLEDLADRLKDLENWRVVFG
jgi:hypothetical protein